MSELWPAPRRSLASNGQGNAQRTESASAAQPQCQADRALVATVSKTKELKRRYGAKRDNDHASFGSCLPCERLSFQRCIHVGVSTGAAVGCDARRCGVAMGVHRDQHVTKLNTGNVLVTAIGSDKYNVPLQRGIVRCARSAKGASRRHALVDMSSQRLSASTERLPPLTLAGAIS